MLKILNKKVLSVSALPLCYPVHEEVARLKGKITLPSYFYRVGAQATIEPRLFLIYCASPSDI
jgi:hypothetical protein